MKKKEFYKRAAMFASYEKCGVADEKKMKEDKESICRFVETEMGVTNLTIADYREFGYQEEVKITFDVENFDKMDFIPAPEELNCMKGMVFVHVTFVPSFFYPGFQIIDIQVQGVTLNNYTKDMMQYFVRKMLMLLVS